MEQITRAIGWWLINIDQLFALFIVLGGCAYVFSRKKMACWLLTISMVGFLVLSILPCGVWLMAALENQYVKPLTLPAHTKGIILLGGSFDRPTTQARGETSYNLAGGRLVAFMELAHKHPGLQRIFTGAGQAHWGASEAALAKDVFQRMNIDPKTVIFEDASKNTIENATLTKALVNPQPQDVYLLVTSAFHMPRSMALFRKAGWNVVAYPVDYHTQGTYSGGYFVGLSHNLLAWHYAMGDWASLLQNYIYGHADFMLPKAS